MSGSKYFKTPSNWGTSNSNWGVGDFIKKEHEVVNLNNQAYFHNYALREVKSSFKGKCTFLAHTSKNGEVGFLAMFNIKDSIKRFVVSTEGKTASDLVAEDYKKLKEVLDERTRS